MTELVSPLLNIIGEQVALGPLHRERFLALDLLWANDFAVTIHHGQAPHPVTQEMVAARYERITRSPSELWFFIYERTSLRPIGTTFFSEMDRVNRTAEFNISIGATDRAPSAAIRSGGLCPAPAWYEQPTGPNYP